MTKLTASQFRAFVVVVRGYTNDLKACSSRAESFEKAMDLMKLMETFTKVEFFRGSVELIAAKESAIAEAKAAIAAERATRVETITFVVQKETSLFPKPAKPFGPGDHDPITGMSWERMMSE